MNKVFMITINSAVEEVIYAELYEEPVVGEIISKESFYTGKAVNSGLVLSNLNICCDLKIVCGEDTSEIYSHFNSQYRKVKVYPVKGQTRRNQTIVVSNGKEYKVINKGYSLLPNQLDELSNDVINEVGLGDYVLIAGSLPEGIPNYWYRELIKKLRRRGGRVFLDTANDVLEEGIKGHPYYIKPNETEFSYFGNKKNISDISEKIKEISIKNEICNVIVTLGEQGALGYNNQEDKVIHVYSDEVFPSPSMTTGCGDSFNAGFIYGELKGMDFLNSLIYGVAFGGANIRAGFPERIKEKDIMERLQYIKYKIL